MAPPAPESAPVSGPVAPGADSAVLSRVTALLWPPAHLPGSAGARHPRGAPSRGAPHACAWDPQRLSPPPAPARLHRATGRDRRQCVAAGVYGHISEPEVGRGHHLRADAGRLAVRRGAHGPVLPTDHWLGHGGPLDGAADQPGLGHGPRPTGHTHGPAPPFGSWLSIWRNPVSAAARDPRHP